MKSNYTNNGLKFDINKKGALYSFSTLRSALTEVNRTSKVDVTNRISLEITNKEMVKDLKQRTL